MDEPAEPTDQPGGGPADRRPDDPPHVLELGADVDAEIGRVAAHLDAEVRAEQAEYEAMALQASRRARRLTDVAREWMARGDTVEVVSCGLALTGRLTHVGTDLLVLSTPVRGRVDVSLEAGPLLRQVVADPDGIGRQGPGPRTFVARLTEHEVDAARVVVTLLDGTQVDGVVLAVAVDHLLLGSPQGTRALPLSRIGLVWPHG